MYDAFKGLRDTQLAPLALKKEEAPELTNLAHNKEDAISAIITRFNQQVALAHPPEDLHNIQEHMMVGQPGQAPASTGTRGHLMIGEGMTFSDGLSDDEGMTFGEPPTATTTKAQKGKKPRKPPARKPNRTAKPSSLNPKKHNKGKTGRAAAPKPPAATRGNRKAPKSTTTKPKESRKWYVAVVALLTAEARRILAEKAIHHPTEEQIDETITNMLRDAVLRMHRMKFPKKPLPSSLKFDNRKDRAKIKAIMAHCVPLYQKIFKENDLFRLLGAEDKAALALFPTRDLTNLYITTTTGTPVHRFLHLCMTRADVRVCRRFLQLSAWANGAGCCVSWPSR